MAGTCQSRPRSAALTQRYPGIGDRGHRGGTVVDLNGPGQDLHNILAPLHPNRLALSKSWNSGDRGQYDARTIRFLLPKRCHLLERNSPGLPAEATRGGIEFTNATSGTTRSATSQRTGSNTLYRLCNPSCRSRDCDRAHYVVTPRQREMLRERVFAGNCRPL